MKELRIAGIVGARPNFMKIAPIARLLRGRKGFAFSLIHTGQHYDGMSDPFFRDLELPDPTAHLKVGSQGSAAEQIGLILTRLPAILQELKPDLVLVVGDVNSTVAGAIAAHKQGIPVGHVEAGLRSFDETMPEEINRRLTDQISEFCFTPSADGDRNLRREGIPARRIHRVGNLMIDTLLRLRPRASSSTVLKTLSLSPGGYVLVTLHRPSNVDREADLRSLLGMLESIARDVQVVFPIHPRTRARIDEFRLKYGDGVKLVDPLGYLDFLELQQQARWVMTDSGGIQEETTVLGVPCLTLRNNTERPITITRGTNRLAGTDPKGILRQVRRILRGDVPRKRVPPLWDGRSAERLIAVLRKAFRP